MPSSLFPYEANLNRNPQSRHTHQKQVDTTLGPTVEGGSTSPRDLMSNNPKRKLKVGLFDNVRLGGGANPFLVTQA